MTTKGLASEISWSFGLCDSNQQYQDYKEYRQTCCFLTSPTAWLFDLKCKDSHGDGWNGAFITINGRKYCEEFSNGPEMITHVEANPSKYECFKDLLLCLKLVIYYNQPFWHILNLLSFQLMVAGVKMILLLALEMEHVENLQRQKLNHATIQHRLSTEENVLAMALYLLFFIQNMIAMGIPK